MHWEPGFREGHAMGWGGLSRASGMTPSSIRSFPGWRQTAPAALCRKPSREIGGGATQPEELTRQATSQGSPFAMSATCS